MKKLFTVFACLVLTMSFAITVSAVDYYDCDLTKSYTAMEYNGAMRRVYVVQPWLYCASGETDISCANDQTGYASCAVWIDENTYYSSKGSTKDKNGWVCSGIASSTVAYAYRMNHYGRRYTGTETEYFQCDVWSN